MELTFLETGHYAIQTALKLAIPILGLSLITGFIISIFQAVTSIQEQTLTFVPKIIATGIAVIFFAPYMYRVMLEFSTSIFGNLHTFVK